MSIITVVGSVTYYVGRFPAVSVYAIAGVEAGFKVFVRSVFYVGKGRRSRPYEHFKEAVIFYRQTVRRKV